MPLLRLRPRPRATRLPLPVLLPLLLGVTCLVGALLLAMPNVRFLAKADRAEARFIGAITGPDGSHGGTFYHPRFRFETGDGSVVSFTSRSGSTSQPYADGDRVTVWYDPVQPQAARLNTIAEMWMGPLLLGGAGLLLTAIGATIAVAWRRHGRAA